MLILIEGSDRAGKSTLARSLRVRIEARYPRHSIRVIHKGPPTVHPLEEYENPLFWYRPGQRTHVICDRWHLGERVYPQVLGRRSRLTTAAYDHIELFLRSRGALLVHVSAPVDVLAARLAQENVEHPDRSLVNANQLVKSAGLIESEVKLSSLPKMTIDSSREFRSAVVDELVLRAEELARGAQRLSPFATYVGPPNPKLLLVGDVRHEYRTWSSNPEIETAARADRTPAFVPYPSTSGHYLLDALGYRPDLGLVNACDVDDAQLLWLATGRPPTVALGRHARTQVEKWDRSDENVKIGYAPHPQFVRRFANRFLEEYGRIIEQSAINGEDNLGWRPQKSWFDRMKSTDSSVSVTGSST